MPATKEYFWDWINPGETVGVYEHGWDPSLAAVFSVTPYVLVPNPAQFPDVFLSQGKVDVHVDATIARTAFVQNNGFQPCAVQLNSLWDSL